MSDIRWAKAGSVFEITLDRPSRKNALSVAMYTALTEALAAASADDSVRVVLLRGAGGVFTSGNDLKDFLAAPPTGDASAVFQFLASLVGFEKPLVAAVEGHAIGVGTTMLLHCDLVYAADTARFALPFVNLALVPEAASSFLLPRMMGHPRAAELFFFGEPFGAETARELGIVNAVYPAAQLATEVESRVRALAEKPPQALRETKRLLKAPLLAETRARMQDESAAFIARLASPEVAEAIAAFFEKRSPRFNG